MPGTSCLQYINFFAQIVDFYEKSVTVAYTLFVLVNKVVCVCTVPCSNISIPNYLILCIQINTPGYITRSPATAGIANLPLLFLEHRIPMPELFTVRRFTRVLEAGKYGCPY